MTILNLISGGNIVDILDRKDITTDILLKLTDDEDMVVGEIIKEHLKIYNIFEEVAVGTDLNCSEAKIRKIDTKGHDIRLVFVTKDKVDKKYKAIYTADLIDILICHGREKDFAPEKKLVPQYYRYSKRKAWFKVLNFRKLSENEIELDDYCLLFDKGNKSALDSLQSRPSLLYVFKSNKRYKLRNYQNIMHKERYYRNLIGEIERIKNELEKEFSREAITFKI